MTSKQYSAIFFAFVNLKDYYKDNNEGEFPELCSVFRIKYLRVVRAWNV